jgi:hypothetical protein
MWRRVAVVITDDSEECIASIIMVTRIVELGTLAVTTNRSVLRLLVTANAVPSWLNLSPWWWRRQVPPKRRFLHEPRGVTFQKKALFIVTAVKISNRTRCNIRLLSYLGPWMVSKAVHAADIHRTPIPRLSLSPSSVSGLYRPYHSSTFPWHDSQCFHHHKITCITVT